MLIIVLILTNTKIIGQTGVLISVDKNNICPEENILLSVKNYDNPYPYALILVSFDGTNYINLFTPGVGHELQLLTYDPTRISTIFNYPTTEGNTTTSMRRVYYKVEYWDDVEHTTTPKFSNVIFIDVKPSANVHSFGFDNANQLLCLNATALDIIPKNPVGTLFSWYKLTPNALDFVEVPGQINQTTSTLPSSKIKTDTIGVTYYRIIAKYGTECPADTGSTKVTVIPDNTISLSSGVGTNNQTKCINTAITNITYATTGATGATFTGLPAGVTGSWLNNVVTISGTPSVAGTFNYTVTLTGGCSVITTTGIISVTPANTISLSSAVGTNNQTLCINTAITNITYATTGATGATFTGLPAGVTGSWLNNVITISGTPTVAGTFNYTVTLTGGCSVITSTGTIISNINTIILSSAVGTNSQTLCINAAITNITYATTGATGATFTGLPAGVTGSWLNNVATISGTPSVAGTFNYTVTLTGGCSDITANGFLTIIPDNTISLSSAIVTINQTLCINTAITNITYATTGATGATFTGLPAGVTGSWLNNVVTISGTPTVAGTFNYTVTLTGSCGLISANGYIKVNKLPTIIANSNSPYICYGDTLILFGSGGVIYNWDNNVKNGVGFVPKNTLIYNLVGIDINGCQNSDKIKIEVVIKPVAEYINSVKNNLMVQEAMNLSPVQFLGAPPFKYFWLTSSNAAIIDSNKFPTMIVGSKVGVVAVSFYIIDARGCKSNVSELLHLNIIATDIKFEVPNAFMPTADYIENRTLRPSFNFAVKEVKYFKIFNRMGQLVYEVYNTTPEKIIWNGIVNGNIQMSDVYVWIAEISGLGEKSLVNKSGQFLLLK